PGPQDLAGRLRSHELAANRLGLAARGVGVAVWLRAGRRHVDGRTNLRLHGRRRRDDTTGGRAIDDGHAPGIDPAEDLRDVAPGLPIRRDSVIIDDRLLAGVVRRYRERDVAVEAIQQAAQVTHAAVDVLVRIERVAHGETRRRGRHELHEAAGALA